MTGPHALLVNKLIMNTTYKNRITSPYQIKKIIKDPLKNEVARNTGSFNLSVTVEEDVATKSQFNHINGFVGFITTIKRDGVVLGIGRGSTILNKMNKYVERGMRFAYGGSLIDAITRSVRTLDDLFLKTNTQDNSGFLNEETNEIDYTPELATDRQKSYLRQLISLNVIDEEEREQWESHLEELTKDEASEKIQFFVK